MSDPQRKQPPPPPPGYAPRYDPGQQPGYAPPPPGYGQPPYAPDAIGQASYGAAPTGYQPMPSSPAGYASPAGPTGRMRPTGMTILLFFVTFGIWGLIYYFQVQEEMRRHSGQGLGGVLALVIAIVFGIVSPFLLSHEVGQLSERRGQRPPVTALTALWFFPGIFILVGPFIWFIRTNNALNEYWRSLGVRETTLV
ncbi:DUF4234 domain-containing protein [Geodermatophilus sp. CPCC 205761]|uniref:DUF4234 domain-containing protein n=1 Tax=Geodermatophilus sp. CPCC 205761 TaxID=2936597 RepID=UPI003EEDD987